MRICGRLRARAFSACVNVSTFCCVWPECAALSSLEDTTLADVPALCVVSEAGEEAGAAPVPAADHRRLWAGQLRHAVHQRARAADPRRRVSPVGPTRAPPTSVCSGLGGRCHEPTSSGALCLCPQGRHQEDRPVRVRRFRVHQPLTAVHRGVRVRRPLRRGHV